MSPRPRSAAGLVALLSVGLLGCAVDGGGSAAGGGRPVAAVLAAPSSVVSSATGRPKPHHRVRAAARQRSGFPAFAPSAARLAPTPPGPPRRRAPQPARAAAVSDAAQLAVPACAMYTDALAGRFPKAVLARGAGRAPAFVAESAAAALLGLPVVAPRASRHSRERLDAALARLTRALSEADDAAARAIADAMRPRIRAYAAELDASACG
jgi:hypothetical protein